MIGRRHVVGAGLAAPALLAFGRSAAAGPEPLFPFGVASGEPTADGAVLWTRLARQPLAGDGGMGDARVPVRWEVYADERLQRRVRAGDAVATAHDGHSLHVEVSGLAPGRPYWFRFLAGGQASTVGRTRTAPAPGTMVPRLRFCFGSCQKYEDGFYAAWADAVAQDPDLIVFLGDYIYEAKPSAGTPRVHLNPEPVDLAGYRVRYATYRLDPLLQAAHAAAPWLVTWDDHEVANDYAGLLNQQNDDPAAFAPRRAAAYQAYWEFMPLRRAARPVNGGMRLYRTCDWGALAQFQIIDDRQYRSARACYPPALLAEHRTGPSLVADCPDLIDPRRTILGWPQERWLGDALAATRARWNVLAQQTQLTPYPRRDPERPDDPRRLHTVDTWEGYQGSRTRLLDRWVETGTPNPLVIGGDIHAFVASDLHHRGQVVAPCYIGGSITTRAHDPLLAANTAEGPGYRFADNTVRGYGMGDLTPTHVEMTFRAVADPRDPASRATTLARFAHETRGMLHA